MGLGKDGCEGKELCLEHEFGTGDKVCVKIEHRPHYTQDEIAGMLEIAFINILSDFKES